MRQHIAAYEALDVLPLQGRLKEDSLERHVVRQYEPYLVCVAGDVRMRWCP